MKHANRALRRHLWETHSVYSQSRSEAIPRTERLLEGPARRYVYSWRRGGIGETSELVRAGFLSAAEAEYDAGRHFALDAPARCSTCAAFFETAVGSGT